jgi:hypothetical protein
MKKRHSEVANFSKCFYYDNPNCGVCHVPLNMAGELPTNVIGILGVNRLQRTNNNELKCVPIVLSPLLLNWDLTIYSKNEWAYILMVHCHIVVLTRAHSSLDLHLTTFTTESTLSCPASFANTASSSYDNRWYPYHAEMVELPGAGCSLPTRSIYLGCPGKKNACQLPTVRIPCHKCHINIVVEFERSNAF